MGGWQGEQLNAGALLSQARIEFWHLWGDSQTGTWKGGKLKGGDPRLRLRDEGLDSGWELLAAGGETRRLRADGLDGD